MKTLVTVEMAESILRTNTRNRIPSKSMVEFLSQEMVSGRFLYNGESIIISKSNILLDGQHRLMAVVSSGVSCYFNIERGVDDEVMYTIDTGRARVAADIFDMQGIVNSRRVASATRLIMQEFGTKSKLSREGIKKVGAVRISNSEILDFFNSNIETLEEMSNFSGHLYNTSIKIMTPSQSMAFHYLLSHGDSNDMITRAFIRELYTGTKEGESNLGVLLHKKLVNDKMSLSKLNKRDKINMIIYAHTNYKQGKVFKILKGSVSSVGSLTFPHIKETK